MKPNFPVAALTVLLTIGSADAQEPTAAQLKFFETNIRPALVKHCYQCHSVEAGNSRAGLLLDSRQGLLEGGDSGPALVPGNPDESLLWGAINWDGYEMPPSKKMPASVIAHFKTWIAMGAPDPRERKVLQFNTKISEDDVAKGRKHWAFQPPRSPGGTTIDGLVAAELREQQLKTAEPADAYTLLRRINFDLIGLPPTPEEIRGFRAAFQRNADAAVKEKVDELLARPQYGERWGRHWLDVARYAESSGSRNVSYPHAWRYRDYVIDAFNDDTPYDRFVSEQIAGDLLPVKTDEQWQKNLIATGFLAIGMKHQDEKNPRKFMADMVDEQIDTTTQAVLGLTVACARCHDHKYDPIPTNDYYAMAGIFYSTTTFYGTQRVAQNHRPSELLLLPVIDENAKVSGSRRTQSIEGLKAQLADIDRQLARAPRGKDSRTIRNNRNRVAGLLASMNADGTAKTFGMGVQDSQRPVEANILLSGEVDHPAQQVPRGFVQVLGDLNFTLDKEKSSGRLQLARAMTSRENPLTARVMVNRVWMHLVGKPLVGTPNNFGFSGMKPENQKLLDHLAIEFMDNGWSVKSLIRTIVLSDTYRRSSQYIDSNYAVDPENKYLWRANPTTLDAESMRDAMLALSGQLELTRPYASAVATGAGRPGGSVSIVSEARYRSVYLPIVRDGVLEPLKLFDFPDPNISSAGRSESIVPTQALYMMNGEFAVTQAQAMAATLQRRFRTETDQIETALLWAYGRPATEEELRASTAFFREYKPAATVASGSAGQAGPQAGRRRGGRPGGQSGGDRAPRGRGTFRRPQQNQASSESALSPNDPLVVFCQTLFASARFRIVN